VAPEEISDCALTPPSGKAFASSANVVDVPFADWLAASASPAGAESGKALGSSLKPAVASAVPLVDNVSLEDALRSVELPAFWAPEPVAKAWAFMAPDPYVAMACVMLLASTGMGVNELVLTSSQNGRLSRDPGAGSPVPAAVSGVVEP
jgi:hypothetical protein